MLVINVFYGFLLFKINEKISLFVFIVV